MPVRERRYILRSLFTPGSVKFWSLRTDLARWIYLALLVNADDDGLVECDPKSVLGYVPRYAPPDMEEITENPHRTRTEAAPKPNAIRSNYRRKEQKLFLEYGRTAYFRCKRALEALQNIGLIHRYKTDGKWYAEVNGFTQSQSGKEVRWENPPIPPPSGSLATKLPKDFTYIHKKEHTTKESVPSDSESVFREAHRRFRRIVGKNLGSLGSRSGQWSGLVAKEGSEIILEAIELWAREEKKFLSETKYHRLGIFFNNSAKLIENARIERERAADPAEKSEDGFIEDTTTPTVEDIRPPDYAPLKRNVE